MATLHELNHQYQRLEFLGDRVLNLIVAQYLYEKFPDSPEGELTARLKFTANDNLEEIEGGLPEEFRTELANFISIHRPDGRSPNSDAIEACIGNYFLEKGFEATTAWVRKHFAGQIDGFDPDSDFVSKLKEYSEQRKIPRPDYVPERTENGSNNQILFYYRVDVGGVSGFGSGTSHERAMKAAAHEALKKLEPGKFC